jgi:hypothetical protein
LFFDIFTMSSCKSAGVLEHKRVRVEKVSVAADESMSFCMNSSQS